MEATPVSRTFRMVLGVTYVGLGVYMIFNPLLALPTWDLILSLAFILYGLWRVYRSIPLQ